MNFSIKFFNEQVKDEIDNFQVGEITINDSREIFHSSLSYWEKYDYLLQWKNAIQYICDGHSKSCLVTSMFDPNTANFIFLWSLYLDKDIVYIQNQILFFEQLSDPFDESRIYSFIGDRETVDEEGYQISEWDIQIDALKKFLTNNVEFHDI